MIHWKFNRLKLLDEARRACLLKIQAKQVCAVRLRQHLAEAYDSKLVQSIFAVFITCNFLVGCSGVPVRFACPFSSL